MPRTAASWSTVRPSFPRPDLGLRLAPAAQALHVPWPGARSSPEEKGIPHGCLLSRLRASPRGARTRAVGDRNPLGPSGLQLGWPPASLASCLPSLVMAFATAASPFLQCFCPFFLPLLYISTSRERNNCRVWRINKRTPPREIRGERLCP